MTATCNNPDIAEILLHVADNVNALHYLSSVIPTRCQSYSSMLLDCIQHPIQLHQQQCK